jgi:hypothetical protein
MNKLVNLLVIFLFIQYVIPFIINIIKKNENLKIFESTLYTNLFFALSILIVQFIYNQIMSHKTNITLKNNFLNSLFCGLVVVCGFYIYEDIKELYTLDISSNILRTSFVIMLLTFFMLTKCLLMP